MRDQDTTHKTFSFVFFCHGQGADDQDTRPKLTLVRPYGICVRQHMEHVWDNIRNVCETTYGICVRQHMEYVSYGPTTCNLHRRPWWKTTVSFLFFCHFVAVCVIVCVAFTNVLLSRWFRPLFLEAWQKRPKHVKRDWCTSKETCIYQKRPGNKTNRIRSRWSGQGCTEVCQNRSINIKRGLRTSKETIKETEKKPTDSLSYLWTRYDDLGNLRVRLWWLRKPACALITYDTCNKRDMLHIATNCNMQHIATNCNMQHIAANCNMQHIATNCNMQHIAANCNIIAICCLRKHACALVRYHKCPKMGLYTSKETSKSEKRTVNLKSDLSTLYQTSGNIRVSSCGTTNTPIYAYIQ